MAEVHHLEWTRLEQRMKYHQATTEQLLELWLVDRLQEQARAHLPSPYGSILVRLVQIRAEESVYHAFSCLSVRYKLCNRF